MYHNSVVSNVNRGYFAQTPLSDEALEVFADVILASIDNDNQHPAYTEIQFARKQRTMHNAEKHYYELSASLNASPDIDLEQFAKELRLTDSERHVLELCAGGYGLLETAALAGLNFRTVRRILDKVRRRTSPKSEVFYGLDSIYHTETHKHTYHKPVHCKEQPCRLLGYCKFAEGNPKCGAE